MVRVHLRFHGTVQGVGFRYTTLSFARELSLTGWVKNTPDGSVEAVAEGSREDVEELLSKLQSYFGTYIRQRDVEWLEARKDFDRFSIV